MFFLCLKIFISRLIDVSIGTIRTMFIVKGNKLISFILAFLEIIIWYYAAREALVTDNNGFILALSYSLGYATGTYVGMILNDYFVDGIFNIEVISSKINKEDILKIKNQRFGISVVKTIDNKYILYLSINKKRYKECIKLIKSLDKDSFIIVNDAKLAFNGFIKK